MTDERSHIFYEEQPIDPSRQNKRVLLIDDDPLVGESIKTFLTKAGYETTVVSVGLAALDVATQKELDLIVADIRMPGMDGLETLKAIRELRKQFGSPALPEVILTAYDDPSVREEAKHMGIPDFILKPFELREFLFTIRKNLAKPKKRGRPKNVVQR